jgi:hypothetical protein
VGRFSARRRARSPTVAATVGPIYPRSTARRVLPAGPHRPAVAIGGRLHLAAGTSRVQPATWQSRGPPPPRHWANIVHRSSPAVRRSRRRRDAISPRKTASMRPAVHRSNAGLGLRQLGWLRHGGVLGRAWRAVGVRPCGLFPAISGRSRVPAMAPAGHARPYDGGAIGSARRRRERSAARCGRDGSCRIEQFVHRLDRAVRRRGSVRVAVAGTSQSRASPRRKFRSGHLGQHRDTLPCRPNHPA